MNSKQKRTLKAIFKTPVSGTIAWAELIEGRGSRVRFNKGDETETFHRPHPAKEAKRYQVRAARSFLERIGVTP